MSQHAGSLYHPVNGHPIDVYSGFSWPCLFFGCFWYLVKGMLLMAFVSFGAAIITLGFSWLVFPFLANRQHREFLLRSGWLEKPPGREGAEPVERRPDTTLEKECPRCAERIKLAAKVCRYCQHEFALEELRATETRIRLLEDPRKVVACVACNAQLLASEAFIVHDEIRCRDHAALPE